MPKGGYRPGAGRPKGSRNLSSIDIADTMRHGGRKNPLEYMLEVMNDQEAPPERRDRMAIAAAVYVHAKPLPTKPEEQEAAEVTKQADDWTNVLSSPQAH